MIDGIEQFDAEINSMTDNSEVISVEAIRWAICP